MTTKRVFLFNPENDLALARNLAHYTPPPAASRLKLSGETLPLWYAGPHDVFVCSGVSAQWLDLIQSTFDIRTEPYDYHPEGLLPTPWGWSPAVRYEFWNMGFGYDVLPSEAAIGRIRELSHRRTAAEIARRLIADGVELAPAAVELSSVDDLRAFLDTADSVMFKLPWSSSGRGLLPYSPAERRAKFAQLAGVIRKQGSIMAEPRHNRLSDFAMLFNMEEGSALYRGLSLFITDSNGAYTSNLLMPQQAMEERLAAECGLASLAPMRDALARELAAVVGADYSGPLGVDFLTRRGEAPALCEINLRNTMGHLSLDLYSRHIEEGRSGVFAITPRDAASAERRQVWPEVFGGRLRRGTLFLNQPGSFFDFTATV